MQRFAATSLIVPAFAPDIQRYYNKIKRTASQKVTRLIGRVGDVCKKSSSAAVLARQIGGLKVALKVLVTSGPVNIALPLNDTDTAKAINDFLAKLKNSGFIDNLVAKYMVP